MAAKNSQGDIMSASRRVAEHLLGMAEPEPEDYPGSSPAVHRSKETVNVYGRGGSRPMPIDGIDAEPDLPATREIGTAIAEGMLAQVTPQRPTLELTDNEQREFKEGLQEVRRSGDLAKIYTYRRQFAERMEARRARQQENHDRFYGQESDWAGEPYTRNDLDEIVVPPYNPDADEEE
jgi:hypothetical protein